MSGGHYDHVQSRIIEEIKVLKSDIRLNVGDFSEETLENMTHILEILEVGIKLLDECDWLISGDIGENSFNIGVHKYRKEFGHNVYEGFCGNHSF